jgi:magnesium transporter
VAISRVLVHLAGGGFAESPDMESASDLIRDTRQVTWLDIRDPNDGDLELLRREFGFHELALEDVSRRHQRAKIEHYPGYAFIVFYAAQRGLCEEISLFVGENYLVTTHAGDIPEIAETVERWRKNADRLGQEVAVPVYSLLDAIVDGYFPVIDEIAESVEALEDAVFDPRGHNRLADVFALRRELLRLRRVLAPQREVLNVLIRRDEPLLGEATLLYFQDIYDHVIRLLDTVDLYRDQLSGLMEAHLSVVSNRLNFTMKRMTALATVLMSVNLIASNYGMNFDNMPELRWEFGYFFTLGLMILVGLALVALFRRMDWL